MKYAKTPNGKEFDVKKLDPRPVELAVTVFDFGYMFVLA